MLVTAEPLLPLVPAPGASDGVEPLLVPVLGLVSVPELVELLLPGAPIALLVSIAVFVLLPRALLLELVSRLMLR